MNSTNLYSKLLEERIVFVDQKIESSMAGYVIAQLLYLESENADADITMYINSPGGEITAGMAIYDTMQYIKPDVSTICIGQAASMAAILLAAGASGKRYALPNGEIMIHQPLSGISGQATDIEIHTNYLLKIKKRLNEILSEKTGKDIKTITRDTERDKFLTAEEAKKYGLIDEVLYKR